MHFQLKLLEAVEPTISEIPKEFLPYVSKLYRATFFQLREREEEGGWGGGMGGAVRSQCWPKIFINFKMI